MLGLHDTKTTAQLRRLVAADEVTYVAVSHVPTNEAILAAHGSYHDRVSG